MTTGRDFGKAHYSPLTQINTDTVSRLGFAWDYDTQTNRGLEATPVEVDGVMYASGVNGRVYALDARTGEEIWYFDPHSDGQFDRYACCDEVNRGLAVWEGMVYVGAFDGHLFGARRQDRQGGLEGRHVHLQEPRLFEQRRARGRRQRRGDRQCAARTMTRAAMSPPMT